MLLGVVPYQAHWPDQFRAVADKIKAALGNRVVRIDHIVSTAVPGLAAKPIIDVQVTVQDLGCVPVLVEALVATGLEHRPDADNDRAPPWEVATPAEWEKEYLRTATGVLPRVHVHIRERGRRNQRYALLFRDYLRAHERARAAYGAFKSSLGESVGHLSGPGGSGLYLELKNPMLDLIMDAAETWARTAKWTPPPADL